MNTPTHTPQQDQPRTDTPAKESVARVVTLIAQGDSFDERFITECPQDGILKLLDFSKSVLVREKLQPVQVVDFYREAAC